MEAPSDLLRRKQKRSRCKCISVAVGATIVIVLAIVIPLAAILPRQRHSRGLPSFVLLPLYDYPVPGAWEPLYEVLRVHSDVNFTVIVNPKNGPGSTQYPEDAYAAAIQNLSVHSNVRTVGYVRTGWTSRDISSVLSEVSTYSGWSSFKSNDSAGSTIAVHGIFFDETPNEYTAEAADYLKTINQAAKNASGLLSDRLVIHNPGTMIDVRLDDPSTDINVIFEKPYQTFQDEQGALASAPFDRLRCSYLINSVPTMSFQNLGNFVDSMSEHAAALFVTDLKQDYYKSFGSQWKDFIDVLPT